MKILTRIGEVAVSLADLLSYDKTARRQLTNAKRAKTVRVCDNTVHFKVLSRCTLPTEMQTLLRHLVNIHKHGKAYAPDDDEIDRDFERVHAQISRGQGFVLPVKFNLDTGELTLDLPP